MKKTAIKFLAAIAVAIATCTAAQAQNAEISPYSRLGYGSLNDHANTAQKAMGGVGIALSDGHSVNFMNPASYAAIDSVTFLFDMAANVKYLKTNETVGGQRQAGHDFTGGLDYITLQFPLTRYGGMCVGLVPWSQVGYSFGNEIANGTNQYSGSGTVNELFVGLAARPFKGLSAGVNVSYMFGNLLNDAYVYGTDNGTTTLFERVMEIRDYNIRVGVQGHFNLDRDNQLSLGLIWQPAKSLHGKSYGVKYDVNQDTKNDTIGYADRNMAGKYKMPDTWGAGVAWIWKKQLTVTADYTYQPWKGMAYKAIEGFDQVIDPENRFADRWKWAFGAQYAGARRGNYFRRINYRAGAFFGQDYIKAGANNVKEHGMSLGLGLPAPSSKTMINLTFEWRHRQGSPQKLVSEDYFQVTLGMNINEIWFWQDKLR